MYERTQYQLEQRARKSDGIDIVAYVPAKLFGRIMKTDQKDNLKELVGKQEVVHVKELSESIGLVMNLGKVAATSNKKTKAALFKRLTDLNMGLRALSEPYEKDARLDFTMSGKRLKDTSKFGMQERVLLPRRPVAGVADIASEAMQAMADTMQLDSSRAQSFGAHILSSAGMVTISTEEEIGHSLQGRLTIAREVTLSSRTLASAESQYIGLAAGIAIARAENRLPQIDISDMV